MKRAPAVSVITATYHWPKALELAIKTVLYQSFEDFEYIIVGDGCSDNTEDVVKGFNDDRIRWRNLPQNSGNQSGPNQVGLDLATAPLIAYLNHDDLWFPDHLEVLVGVLRATGAPIATSLCIEIAPPGNSYRGVIGLPKQDQNGDRTATAMTTCVMHTAEAARTVGGWRDWRSLSQYPTAEFFQRLLNLGGGGVVPIVTALKFHSADRPGSYVLGNADEQAAYLASIRTDDQLRHKLLALAALSQSMGEEPPGAGRFRGGGADAPLGWGIEQLRLARGLSPMLE